MKKSIPSTTVPTCSLTFILVHIYGTYVQSNIFMKVYVLQLFSGSDGNLVFIPHDLRAFGLPDITLLLVDQSALLLIPLACCQYCCTCTMVKCFYIAHVSSSFLQGNYIMCIAFSGHVWVSIILFTHYLVCAMYMHYLLHTSASERVLLQVTQVLLMKKCNV